MTTKGFQHVITINQKAVIECGLNVDIVDMAIFDFMKSYSASPKCTKVFFENKFYFYLSSSVILERMPMLGISTKRGIGKRIDNLINAGLLERHPNNQEIGKAMYTFGSMYDRYIFCTTQEQKFQGGTNESSEGVRTEVPTPMNESSDDNSTIYNNTNDNNTIYNSPSTPPQGIECEELSQEKILFEEFRKVYLGTKRGLDIEFANFCKKHKDWREVLPYLKVNYERQIEAKKSQRGSIDPRYEKHLQTYINQRCWEEEISYGSNTHSTNHRHEAVSATDKARQRAIETLRANGYM